MLFETFAKNQTKEVPELIRKKYWYNILIYLICTQPIINPNYDDSDGGDKSTLRKWTVKSYKCVVAKDLLFSVSLTFTVPPEIKKTIDHTHTTKLLTFKS